MGGDGCQIQWIKSNCCKLPTNQSVMDLFTHWLPTLQSKLTRPARQKKTEDWKYEKTHCNTTFVRLAMPIFSYSRQQERHIILMKYNPQPDSLQQGPRPPLSVSDIYHDGSWPDIDFVIAVIIYIFLSFITTIRIILPFLPTLFCIITGDRSIITSVSIVSIVSRNYREKDDVFMKVLMDCWI